MKTISRYIMTLALLLTAATGAWADETYTVKFEANGNTVTKENVTLPYTFACNFVMENGELDGIIQQLYNLQGGSCDSENTPSAIGNSNVTAGKKDNGSHYITISGPFEGTSTVTGSYSNYSNVFTYTLEISIPGYVAPAETDVEVTTNAEEGETTFTEASFNMPAYDATAEYELVRDLATSTKVDLIIGTGSDAVTATADTRLRIAKSNNVYAPISALSCNFVDQIENTTIAATAFADAKLTPQFYLQGDNNTWTLVTDINATTKLPNNLQPGQVYCITLKAADGSYYDGETQPSYTVTLFEGYEVAVPAGEYVTFYKDEPLYADPVSSTDAVLYTISSVSTTDGTATLSDAIATAPSNTPLLVYNSNTSEDATFLLIPADAEPNLALTVAPEFIGTTEATTIAASTSTKNNYALNGKQFVWVKNALAIGANKAWLTISTGNPSARALTIVFDDTTRIDSAVRTNDNSNDDYYDLNGRKLQGKPTRKGVYIKNGKKEVVK